MTTNDPATDRVSDTSPRLPLGYYNPLVQIAVYLPQTDELQLVRNSREWASLDEADFEEYIFFYVKLNPQLGAYLERAPIQGQSSTWAPTAAVEHPAQDTPLQPSPREEARPALTEEQKEELRRVWRESHPTLYNFWGHSIQQPLP